MSFDTLPSGKVVHLPCGWPMAPSFPGQGQSPWPQRRCELASSMRTTPKWPNGQDGRWRMFFMIKAKHKQAHTRTQTKTREISGIIVGLEAQFVVTAKEGVFRLGLRFPVGLHSVLSKTPSGELTLRWPRRPSPPRIENLESVNEKRTLAFRFYRLVFRLVFQNGKPFLFSLNDPSLLRRKRTV